MVSIVNLPGVMVDLDVSASVFVQGGDQLYQGIGNTLLTECLSEGGLVNRVESRLDVERD